MLDAASTQDLALYQHDGPIGDNPYLAVDVRQDDPLEQAMHGLLARTAPVAPAGTDEAAAFLRAQHAGPLQWRALCLKLQRSARRLPAVYPSALAAAVATPEDDRVYDVDDLRRGMVAYSDDPNDSNPYGHIYFILGRNEAGQVLTFTNDARRSGGVDIVPLDFYASAWGDRFQFGATSLNGYDLPGIAAASTPTKPETKPKPKPGRVSIGDNLDHAIDDLESAVRHHRKKGHTGVVKALLRDLAELRETRKKFPR